jgi:HSP20 family protein
LRDDDRDPFLSLHREVNRLFDDVFRGFGSGLPSFGHSATFGGSWPSVEICDTEKEIKVVADVPGLEEKDIEVLLNDGVLTLKGEKRSESEGRDRQFSERYYGRFERRIPLGVEVKEDQVDATFRNGVLNCHLAKDRQGPVAGQAHRHQEPIEMSALRWPGGLRHAFVANMADTPQHRVPISGSQIGAASVDSRECGLRTRRELGRHAIAEPGGGALGIRLP